MIKVVSHLSCIQICVPSACHSGFGRDLDEGERGQRRATVLSLMADDVVFLVAGQPPMRGKAAFASAQSGLTEIDIDATSEIEEIRVFGDWAYIWTNLNLGMTPKSGGAPVKRAGNTLSILQKQNGAWLIFRDANMLAPVSE